jgi:hypothetical protein
MTRLSIIVIAFMTLAGIHTGLLVREDLEGDQLMRESERLHLVEAPIWLKGASERSNQTFAFTRDSFSSFVKEKSRSSQSLS